jgi:hypothetical protein
LAAAVSSSMCAVADPAIDCTPVVPVATGLLICRVAIAIFTGRSCLSVYTLIGRNGGGQSRRLVVVGLSGGPSDGPIDVLGGDGTCTPVLPTPAVLQLCRGFTVERIGSSCC